MAAPHQLQRHIEGLAGIVPTDAAAAEVRSNAGVLDRPTYTLWPMCFSTRSISSSG